MSRTKTTAPERAQEPSATATRPYHQVATALRQRIRSGEWTPGSMTPGRRALASEFGVALTTVERAVAALIAEGLLRADDRRGTFVAAVPEEAPVVTPLPLRGPALPSTGTVGVGPLIIISTLYRPDPAAVTRLASTPEEFVAEGAAGAAAVGRIRSVLRSLEAEYSQGGGLTHFLNRAETEQGRWSVGAATRAALEGAPAAIAFVGIDEEYQVDVAGEIVAALNLRPEWRRTPVVYVSWGDECLGLRHVYYDNGHAGYLAAEHLLFNGWRRLLYLDIYGSVWSKRRLYGAQEAARRASGVKLTVIPSSSLERSEEQGHAGPQVQMGYQTAREALQAGLFAPDVTGGPCGVIAPNDFAAIGALRAFREAGLVPGKDFALIGFDDLDQARELGLSSVRPPLEGLGTEAGRILVATVRGEPAPNEVCLGWHLSARASTAPITAAGR